MPDIAVVPPPPIGRVANVELVHTGTWALSTGPATFTVEDLASAVSALDCPAVRRPILKLGHTPDPAPGQPAVGFIANMAVAENGRTLVGDYVGLPGWLVAANADGDSVLSSAYPDRSIEGWFDFRCQLGHDHPFVITAVVLLGTEQPGVATLQSLQDLADLYGVAAQSGQAGIPITIPIRASLEEPMPAPRLAQVAAGVTTEDVRRAFYSTPAGAGWDTWIEEMQLTPEQQLIVIDDASGTRSRIPIVIGDGDGEAAVSFGAAVPVVIRYEDAPTGVAASAGTSAIRYASRDESRPATPPSPPPVMPPSAPARPAPAPSTSPAPTSQLSAAQAAARIHNARVRGAGMDPAMLREALGLATDAPDTEVTAALASAGYTTQSQAVPAAGDPPDDTTLPPVVTPPVAASGATIVLDSAQYSALRQQAMRGDEAFRMLREQECEGVLDAAIKAGKFPPARRDHWKQLWAADPDGTKATIEKLASNVIPVSASGYPGVGDETETDLVFAAMYPDSTKAGGHRG